MPLVLIHWHHIFHQPEVPCPEIPDFTWPIRTKLQLTSCTKRSRIRALKMLSGISCTFLEVYFIEFCNSRTIFSFFRKFYDALSFDRFQILFFYKIVIFSNKPSLGFGWFLSFQTTYRHNPHQKIILLVSAFRIFLNCQNRLSFTGLTAKNARPVFYASDSIPSMSVRFVAS